MMMMMMRMNIHVYSKTHPFGACLYGFNHLFMFCFVFLKTGIISILIILGVLLQQLPIVLIHHGIQLIICHNHHRG